MLFYFRKKNQAKSGLSIIEVLAVITVITIGLVGLIPLLTQSMRIQYVNKFNLVASQLAQEGLELVRNKRDSNWIAAINWNNMIGSSTSYTIDYLMNIDRTVGSINDSRTNLKLDANGFYWHGAGTETGFSRLITVVDEDYKLVVSCTVRWKEKNNIHDYVATTEFYDWH